MTFKQWIENYWYHYKWHTIIGLFLVITLAVGVTQCATKPKYDGNCVLYCDRFVNDNTAAALEEQLAKRITDTDGNGTVAFQVYNLSYDSDSTTAGQVTFSNSQKILAVATTADYVLYVVDEYGYDRLMDQELFAAYDKLPHKEGTAWNWKGSPLQQEMKEYALPENLYFCVRKVAGTAAQSEEGEERAKAALALIETLIAE